MWEIREWERWRTLGRSSRQSMAQIIIDQETVHISMRSNSIQVIRTEMNDRIVRSAPAWYGAVRQHPGPEIQVEKMNLESTTTAKFRRRKSVRLGEKER